MEKVRAKYKRVAGKKRPFPFECWWRAIKDQPNGEGDLTQLRRCKKDVG